MTATMTQTEHLQLIRARCVELLEIAEKRTAGAWVAVPRYTTSRMIEPCEVWCGDCTSIGSETVAANATFIASCAGAAEAGWRATIDCIDGLLAIDAANGKTVAEEYDHADTIHAATQYAIAGLIEAWPIELLNNK